MMILKASIVAITLAPVAFAASDPKPSFDNKAFLKYILNLPIDKVGVERLKKLIKDTEKACYDFEQGYIMDQTCVKYYEQDKNGFMPKYQFRKAIDEMGGDRTKYEEGIMHACEIWTNQRNDLNYYYFLRSLKLKEEEIKNQIHHDLSVYQKGDTVGTVGAGKNRALIGTLDRQIANTNKWIVKLDGSEETKELTADFNNMRVLTEKEAISVREYHKMYDMLCKKQEKQITIIQKYLGMYLNAAKLAKLGVKNVWDEPPAKKSPAAIKPRTIRKQDLAAARIEAQKGYEQMVKTMVDTVKNNADKKFAKETPFTERVMKTMQTGIDEAAPSKVLTHEEFMNKYWGNNIRRRLMDEKRIRQHETLRGLYPTEGK